MDASGARHRMMKAFLFLFFHACLPLVLSNSNTAGDGDLVRSDPRQQQSRRDEKAVVEIQIYTADSRNALQFQFYGSPYINGPFGKATSFDESKGSLDLHAIYLNGYGCEPLSTLKNVEATLKRKKPFALFVKRGKCPFLQKMENAGNAGASALFIVNQLNSLYANDGKNGSRILKDMCDVFAHVEPGEVDRLSCDSSTDSCGNGGGSSGCHSGVCLPFRAKAGMSLQSCCLDDKLMAMYIDKIPNLAKQVPSIFVNVGDGIKLAKLFNASSGDLLPLVQNFATDSYTPFTLSIRPREVKKFDLGVLIVGMFAVITIVISTYRSAKVERMVSNLKYGPSKGSRGNGDNTDSTNVESIAEMLLARSNQPERQTLSSREVLATVAFSAFSMAVLYGLIKLGVNIVTIFNFWFIAVTASSIDVLLLNPFLTPYYSNREGPLFAHLNSHIVNTKYLKLTNEMVLRFFVSLTLPVWWYIAMFNNAGYTWVLQNTLGAFVCCYLALILRLPNLKVGTICLILFLVYDVFMVFLTPFIFGGESIMMEVATAGGRNVPSTKQTNTSVVPSGGSAGSATQLTTCHRNPGERMPLLMQVPHFNEWPGGYAMLGLGDIMIPSLFLSLALRFDYHYGNNPCCANGKRRHMEHRNVVAGIEFTGCNQSSTGVCFRPTYWVICIFFYAIALCLANLANIYQLTIAGVKGQPALMWIDPLLIIPTILVAKMRGQYAEFWHGVSNASNSTYDQLADAEDTEDLVDAEDPTNADGIEISNIT